MLTFSTAVFNYCTQLWFVTNHNFYFSDMESAEGVLNVMKESNLEPTSDTYTLLASGYAKNGDIAKVVDVFDTCDNKEIYLSDKEYLDIVYSLAINGHGDKIDQVSIFLIFHYILKRSYFKNILLLIIDDN